MIPATAHFEQVIYLLINYVELFLFSGGSN
jgi:hypothetical protein